ncbi:MAG: C1 family peptidase [Pseudomonadota bacterium]
MTTQRFCKRYFPAFLSLLFNCLSVFMPGVGTAEAAVHLTGLSMSPQSGLTAGGSVTFTASAISEEGGTIYYRFDLIPSYGTDQYDPYNHYTTIQGFSTSNTCTYSFSNAGDYIVVVFASPAMSVSADNAIIGKNVSIGRSNTVHLGSLDLGLIKTVKVGETITFRANAVSDTQASVYYRFDLIPSYGTTQYNPYNNYTTLQNYSTLNTCSHTFSSAGKYILVVFASYGQGTQYATMPIAGGSISVTETGDPDSANNTGNQEFDRNNAVATDALYGFRSETPANTLLPTSMDYTGRMPSVKSQGSTSSCTSWATGYYYKTYQESIEEGWDQNQNTFSPMYLYSLQCRNYTQPWSFIAAWETLNQYGCAKYTTMPFVDLSGSDEKSDYSTVTIPSAATTEARNFRCGERSQLEGLSQVKQALTRGPVLLGINQYANLHLSSSWQPSPENNYITHDASNSNVGHAILCVGYDDSKFGTGALKFINSWGSDWAIDGFSWLRYSDYSNIVLFSMSIQDTPNANRTDTTTSKPVSPSNVTATDDAGPYVDISWSTVSGAQYYRIFRRKVSDASTYGEIGTAYQGGFRDNPEAGVAFYYSVVSYNDVGNSEHFASDTDAKDYVDTGRARGSSMTKPTLSWLSNDNAGVRSNFSVSNLASDVSAMEVLVAGNSEGPWASFGYAAPGNFSISWGQDSEYIGKKPFVKIVISSASGTSESSTPVQVAQTLVSSVNVADVTSLAASAQGDGIQVTWSTNGGRADYFEVWRWLAAEDEGNEWIFIDTTDGTASSYTDTYALPGKNYYYAVAAVYQGTYGEFAITDIPASIVSTQANLFLYEVVYDIGEIYNPAYFQLTVWNDGGTTIHDYSINIYVYDWDDGEIYYPFDIFYASDYIFSSLLPPGYSHTLSLSLDLPSAYADGHYYSWIIEIDYDDDINELYEDDNWLITEDGWWSYYLSSAAPRGSGPAEGFSRMALTGANMSSSRPFSKKRVENTLKGVMDGTTLQTLSLDNRSNEAAPIPFKKPSFCVDHGK